MNASLVAIGVQDNIRIVLVDEDQPNGQIAQSGNGWPVATYSLDQSADRYLIKQHIDKYWLRTVPQDQRSATISKIVLNYLY